jgi:hypothetical protein
MDADAGLGLWVISEFGESLKKNIRSFLGAASLLKLYDALLVARLSLMAIDAEMINVGISHSPRIP